MRASAEDEGRVYQAGHDQHITEYHLYGLTPDIDDDDDEEDDDGYDEDEDGSSWGGVLEALLSVLTALVALLPLALAGASIHSVVTAESFPSFLAVLYSVGSLVVGATGFSILRERLSHWAEPIDTHSGLYLITGIGIFVYYVLGDPANLNIKFIADVGLEVAQQLGPL
ncbi:hypothetical protein [Streptomyces marispadix]|nr:hypothetical protein [Streptomyces marispadix]